MIIDSTVLLSLSNIGKLDLISDFIVPEKVLEEIKNEPTRSAVLKQKFKTITPSEGLRKKALEILGDQVETGDSDIVASLLESPKSVIATDDKRLRNVCRSLGGKITGTLGILIQSVRKGILYKDEALSLLKELHVSGFRMSLELYEKVKELLDKRK